MTDCPDSFALNAQDCLFSGGCRTGRPCRCRQPQRANCGRWMVELLPARGYCARFKSPAPGIGFAFDSQRGEHAFASDRNRPFWTRPNSLAFVPLACDVFSRSGSGGEYLKLIPTERDPDREGTHWNATRLFNDRIDTEAIAAAQSIRKQLLAINPPDPLLLEAQAEILAERVGEALGNPSFPRRAERWMTPARLRKVDDLIEGHLDRTLTVASLAKALGLSPGFFSRAFKAAIGKAPHDHIIDRRIARARALLQESERGLSDVALACGFSSHAHMTTVFRVRLGATPAQFRRCR